MEREFRTLARYGVRSANCLEGGPRRCSSRNVLHADLLSQLVLTSLNRRNWTRRDAAKTEQHRGSVTASTGEAQVPAFVMYLVTPKKDG